MNENSLEAPSNMPSDLLQVYESLWQEVAGLHSRWVIFCQLFTVSESQVDFLREMAPSFFGVLQQTFRNDILMSLSRITDPSRTGGKENLSLVLLTERIDPSAFPALRHTLDTSLQEIIAHCTPFRDLRNRTLAHKDLPTALRYHSNPLPGISQNMINDALRMIRVFMNTIQSHFDHSETAYEHIIQRGNGEDIVFYLKQAREYHVITYENEMKKHNINPEG
jgi:hypothetical protein